MTDLYAGSAGGQPRLLIPTIRQIKDRATQIAMQSILEWANRLITGGTGFVKIWVPHRNPLAFTLNSWDAVYFDGSFVSAGQTYTFPANPAVGDEIAFFAAGLTVPVTFQANAGQVNAGIPGFPPGSSLAINPPNTVYGSVVFTYIGTASKIWVSQDTFNMSRNGFWAAGTMHIGLGVSYQPQKTGPVNTLDGSSYIWICNNAAITAFTLTTGVDSSTGTSIAVNNQTGANITLTPSSGTIDGAANKTVANNHSVILACDGTNWYTLGAT